ncbi:MAG: penicillin-binding protein 1B [Gammaproteobacteria bacterium]|jgi:penicillin-binding protein 1B
MARRSRRSTRKKASPKRRRGTVQRRRWWPYAGGVGLVLLVVYVLVLNTIVTSRFEGRRWELPARVFASPMELYPGLELKPADFEEGLRLLHFKPAARITERGTYQRRGSEFRVHTRGFQFASDEEPSRELDVDFSGDHVVSVRDLKSGQNIALARLSPLLIANIYPRHNEDRILVRLDKIPPTMVKGLVSVEDRTFYSNIGLDFRSIARALIADIRAGRIVEGGSTLTQQLVKNLFLTNRRTVWRKANEAVMALLLTAHYSKDEIMETFMNEVYLGQDGQRSIHGVGLASEFYFEKPVSALDLSQQALLIALVRGPSYYDPRLHSKRALARRNLVLRIMAQQGVITDAQAHEAESRPLGVVKEAPSGVTPFPAFLQLVQNELERDYSEEELRSAGLFIFTTLDPLVQIATEHAVDQGLKQVEAGHGVKRGTLQAAAVVASVNNGEVLAVVGGRDVRYAGFNRALDIQRPIGSLVKPAVYLTALAQPKDYTLATLLDDSPLSVPQPDGKDWQPLNYSREYHGQVTLMQALVHSYNVPTARLGLAVGLPNIIDTLHRLGVTKTIPAYPAILLGSINLSPLQVAQMYQTIAASGYRTPLKAVRRVMDQQGQVLKRYPLTVEQAVNASTDYLIQATLHEVTQEGTAQALKSWLPNLSVAGKTGTTNDLRDSWFAGFSGQHTAVVWVGRDDNQPTGLTGATGALRVWADLMSDISTQPLDPPKPDNVEWKLIDPTNGLLADESCADAQWMPFIQGSAPQDFSSCGGGVSGTIRKTFRWFKGLLQ